MLAANTTDALWTTHLSGQFVARTLPGGTPDEPPYAVWVPRDAANGQRALPAILALHGSGERGRDGRRPTTLGLGPLLPALSPSFPALVVFPQASPEEHWRGPASTRALRALDATIAEFGADPERIALTGLSLGGNGAWHLALAVPERFRALAVVCGWLDEAALPPALRAASDSYLAAAVHLRHLPVWIFHGAQDTVVPVAASRRMAAALTEAGAVVRYTEYPEVRHGAWVPAYREPDLFPWLCGLISGVPPCNPLVPAGARANDCADDNARGR